MARPKGRALRRGWVAEPWRDVRWSEPVPRGGIVQRWALQGWLLRRDGERSRIEGRFRDVSVPSGLVAPSPRGRVGECYHPPDPKAMVACPAPCLPPRLSCLFRPPERASYPWSA